MSPAAQPTDTAVISATRQGALGDGTVGIMAVLTDPPRTKISVHRTAPLDTETISTLSAGQQLLLGGMLYTVTLSPPETVVFKLAGPATLAGADLPASVVALDDGDSQLRVNAPDLPNAVDARLSAMAADTATLEIWPTRLPRQDAGGALMTITVHLKDTLALGTAHAHILAIQTAAPDHPARILLQLQAGQ